MTFDPTSLVGGPSGAPQAPQTQQFDVSQTEAMLCEECDNATFEPATIIRRISPIISPDGEEKFAPLQVFSCKKCGHVNSIFRPFDAKDE